VLETAVKTLLVSVIIAFFILSCLKGINDVVSEGILYSRHADGINRLGNDTTCSCNMSDCLIVSMPALINNEPVRVCVNA